MKTRVIVTLGKHSHSEEMVKAMIDNGMDIARITFSHCPYEEYKQRVDWLKKHITDKKVEIMQDLQGPKIRLGTLKVSPLEIKEGETYTFSTEESGEGLFIKYPSLHEKVKAGGLVSIRDGRVRFVIESVEGREIKTKALNNGIIWSRNGLNLPEMDFGPSVLTQKDIDDVKFALSYHKPDYIAISFVRNAEDVKNLKEIVKGQNIKIVSKIETQQAVDNIDEILEESDLIMIARGDLGIEMPIEKLPATQKYLIRKAKEHGRPCIVATGLLYSMNTDSIPSRSDVSDIANAVWDGADMLMLSNETTSGEYPVESLQTLVKVVSEVENPRP